MPSPRRNKDRLQEIGKELATIRAETQKAVSDIQGEISALKERIDKLHRRRWRTNLSLLINVVTIISLVAGLYFQIWLNRPVVDYRSTALGYSYSLIQVTPFNPSAQPLQFEVQNTGQTDISLDVTIAATNCTVSASENGPFRPNATQRVFIQARTNWGPVDFYVKANMDVPSFKVYFLTTRLVDSPDYLTTVIDTRATYNAIGTLALMWVRDPSNPGLYSLQT